MSAQALLAPLLIASAALVPGWAWLSIASPRGGGRAARAGTALALSPGLLGASVALLAGTGVPWSRAAWPAIGAFAVVGIAAAFTRRGAARPDHDPRMLERTAWLAAGIAAGLIGLLPLFSEWYRVYSDCWNHLAIVRSLTGRPGPLMDPFFAGMRLQYPWIYHACMGGLAVAGRVDPQVVFALWSSIALAAVVLCVADAAFQLHRGAVLSTVAFVLLGLNALFPLFAPLLAAKAMIGELRGWPELARTFRLTPFGWDTAGSLLRSFQNNVFFLDKYMVATPFALALAGYAAWVACLLRWLRRRERGELWTAAGLTLTAGLLHPVVAVDLVLTTTAFTGLALLLPRRVGIERPAALAWAAAVLCGALPALLYTARIVGGSGGSHAELPIDVGPWKFIGLFVGLAAGLLFAGRPALEMAREGGARRAWMVWLAASLGLAAVFRLPGGSAYFTLDKFGYFAWIPVALTGGAAVAAFFARRRPATRVALALLLFLPVNGLVLASRIWDPIVTARVPWNLPAFVWMRDHLPGDAVLVVPRGDEDTGVIVRRDQFAADSVLGRQLGYPLAELHARDELCARVFRGDRLPAADWARLHSLGHPVYAVWTDWNTHRFDRMPRSVLHLAGPPPERPAWAGLYTVVYDSDTHLVAELTPGPAGGRELPVPPR